MDRCIYNPRIIATGSWEEIERASFRDFGLSPANTLILDFGCQNWRQKMSIVLGHLKFVVIYNGSLRNEYTLLTFSSFKIYRFNTKSIKIPDAFFAEIGKLEFPSWHSG